jgi:hypothetical protein
MILTSSGGVLVGLIILGIPYFVPSIIAFVRHHHNQWAIFALYLLLGWTILGVHVYHDEPGPPATPPPDG